MSKKKITYKTSGVDIDKADGLIKATKALINTTRIKGSMDSVGGFGGFFDLKKTGIKDPLLVASTDGVGTKLKIAQMIGNHNTVGIDLVAMCVNDIICTGAKPLFFLDYIAIGHLSKKIWTEVIKGIIKGCKESECALLGGETAEMPGMYSEGEYDLAGFSVGVVDRKKAIDNKKIKSGDVILGLASSGFHSNGYSLVRKIFTKDEMKKHSKLILEATKLYVKPVLGLMCKTKVKGIANITGGGFYDNIPRILPGKVKAVIHKKTWPEPKVYKLVREKVKIEEKELYRTFNMGIGMILIMSKIEAIKSQKYLKKEHRLNSYIIGEIEKSSKKQVEIR